VLSVLAPALKVSVCVYCFPVQLCEIPPENETALPLNVNCALVMVCESQAVIVMKFAGCEKCVSGAGDMLSEG
jgi:hypothetical protein